MIEHSHERPLDRVQLRRVVRDLSSRPALWSHLIRHDPDQRVYELLHHDEHVMAWLICWMDDHDTGFHDHDISSGAVAVLEGAIREQRLRLGAEPVTQTFFAGDVFDFAAADIHRVSHEPGAPADPSWSW